MTRSRGALITVLGVRVAYGLGLLIVPDRLTRRWLGPPNDPTRVAARGLGMREVVLHGLALAAVRAGAPVRPFLAASVAGDLTDIAAAVAGRAGLPDGSPVATTIVAGGSAALTIAVGVATD